MTNIERTARAIHQATHDEGYFLEYDTYDNGWEAVAYAAKAALSEDGLVIVPREPTEAMYKVVYAGGISHGFPNNISQNHVGAIWQAMITAGELNNGR